MNDDNIDDDNIDMKFDVNDPYRGLTPCEWQQCSHDGIDNVITKSRIRSAAFGVFFAVFAAVWAGLWLYWTRGAESLLGPAIGVGIAAIFVIVGIVVMIKSITGRVPHDTSGAIVASGMELKASADMPRIMARPDYWENDTDGKTEVTTFDISNVIFEPTESPAWHLVYLDRNPHRRGGRENNPIEMIYRVARGGLANLKKNLDDVSNVPVVPAILEIDGEQARLLIPDTMTRIGYIMKQTVPFRKDNNYGENMQDARISYWNRLAWLDDTFHDSTDDTLS